VVGKFFWPNVIPDDLLSQCGCRVFISIEHPVSSIASPQAMDYIFSTRRFAMDYIFSTRRFEAKLRYMILLFLTLSRDIYINFLTFSVIGLPCPG